MEKPMNRKDTNDSGMARKFDRVCAILEQNNYSPAKLIPILQAIQEEYRYLPEKILTFVATSLDIPPAKIFGVATFYSHFALKAKGKHVIRICDGTACHVRNSIPIVEALRTRLQLTETKNTTDDMLFTIETVSCLGACGLAPVVVIDDEVHSLMNPDKALKLVDEMVKEEEYEHTAN
jgi:NADH-quinone oxidoreductase subunit E